MELFPGVSAHCVCSVIILSVVFFSVDEALWKRTDLANKTLIPGVLGSVLSRGVCILRLTKASVSISWITNVI